MEVRNAFLGFSEWSTFIQQRFHTVPEEKKFQASVINMENVKIDNQPALKSYTDD